MYNLQYKHDLISVSLYLPSDVILMRDISAGVPINEPIAPAVIPKDKIKSCLQL